LETTDIKGKLTKKASPGTGLFSCHHYPSLMAGCSAAGPERALSSANVPLMQDGHQECCV